MALMQAGGDAGGDLQTFTSIKDEGRRKVRREGEINVPSVSEERRNMNFFAP